MATFHDHFSGVANVYQQYRPTYPPALFESLAGLCAEHEMAWDCGTGNGQAAVELAKHFDLVIATDASAEQIANAIPNAKIDYRMSPAEQSPCKDGIVDLVTVAQALHWFDIPRFHAEVQRVLKAGGVYAIIGYRGHRVMPAVDAVLDRFEAAIGPFWPPERAIVEARFATVEFPFAELTPPRFDLEAHWDYSTHLGYLRTWSARKEYIRANGTDPVTAVEDDLAAAWGDPATLRTVTWDPILRVGRKLSA